MELVDGTRVTLFLRDATWQRNHYYVFNLSYVPRTGKEGRATITGARLIYVYVISTLIDIRNYIHTASNKFLAIH
jgi:hypothetical protein